MRKIPLLLCLLATAFVSLAAQTLISLLVTVEGDGAVAVYVDGEETEATAFAYGTEVELGAIPAEGSFFVQWNDGSNTSFFKTITIEDDPTECSVEFHKMDTVKIGVNTVYATYASYQYWEAKGGSKDGDPDDPDDLDDPDDPDDPNDPDDPDDPNDPDDPDDPYGFEPGYEGTPNPNCVFIPTEDGTYIFYTEGDADTYGVLFNSDMEPLEYDDGGAYDDADNFKFSYYLEAGETYYISAGFWNEYIVDEIELHIDIAGSSTITVSAEGEGSVAVLQNGVSTNKTTFDYGTELVLSAKPKAGNFFVQWNEESTDLEYEITVVEDSNYVGKFHEIQPVTMGATIVLATYARSYQKLEMKNGGAKDGDDEPLAEPEVENEDRFEGTPNPNCVFNPLVSGFYTFYTESEADTYGMLFDSEMGYLAHNDSGAGDDADNFKFSYLLKAGETYYISAGFYKSDTVGEISLHIDAVTVTASITGEGEVVFYEEAYDDEEDEAYEKTLLTLDNSNTMAYFSAGYEVDLKAKPAKDNFFVQWGDETNVLNNTLVVENDTTIEAEFSGIQTVTKGVNTILATYGKSYYYDDPTKGGAKDGDEPQAEVEEVEEEIEFEGTPNPNCVFTPEVSGEYTFFTVSDAGTYGVIFDSNMKGFAYSDDYAEEDEEIYNQNFKFSCELEAGKTYYISAGFDEPNTVSELELHIGGPSTIAVSVDGPGSVDVLFEGESTTLRTFDYGTEIVFAAKPGEDAFFVQWADSTNEYFNDTIVVVKDSTYLVEFHDIQSVVMGENTVLATYGKSYYQVEGDGPTKGGAKGDDDDDDDDDWGDDEYEPVFEGTPNPNCVFIPEFDGTYTFYTECEDDVDTYGMLFDSEMAYLADNDDAGVRYNFKFSYQMEAGKAYYITAGFLYADTVAEIPLHIEAVAVTASITGDGEVEVYGVEEGEDEEEVYGDLIATLSKSNSTVCFEPDTTLGLRAKPDKDNFFVQWGDGSKEFNKAFVAGNDTTIAVEFHEVQKVFEGENIVYATFGRSFDAEDDDLNTFNPNCEFVPEVSATYVIFTESNKDTYGVLFASDSTMLTWNDDPAGVEIGEEQPGEPEIDPIHISARNFRFSYDFEEGETYYISAGFFHDTTKVGYTKLQIKAPVTIAVSADVTKGSASISYLADGETIEGVNGAVTVTYGDTVTVSATANENYEFLRWSDGSTDEEHTFEALESNTLVAYFKPVGAVVYDITATSNDNAMGTVTGGSVYLATDEVKLEAIPANHHHFVKWSNGVTENPYTFIPVSDSTLEAEFAIDQFQLTVLAENGTPSLSEPATYNWGKGVNISATADDHYHFVKWSDGVTSESRTIIIKSDTTVTAIYDIDTFGVDVESANGTVTGADAGEYAWNTTLTLEAVADKHYHFVKWADGTITNPRAVTITSDTAFYAEFAIDTFNITLAETVENGTVEGLNKYIYGAEASLKAKPAEGFKFVRWTGWTASDNTVNPLVFTVEEDVVLEPLFIDATKDLYTVTVNATEGGSVTPTGTVECLTGDKVTLTATAAEGYKFYRWSDDAKITQTTREITVTSDTTITAQFRLRNFEILVYAGAHGTVTGGGDHAYNSKATITAIPDKGYHFVKWTETGNTEAEFTITVTEEKKFTAEFAIDNYTIAATAVANGTVEGAGKFDYGKEVTLTATPAAGYHFVKWSNDATANPYKFAAESDLTLTAEFAINTYEVTVTAANGTVTGVGTYNHGAEATLIATAAEGYSFVKWSDGVTEATRKVTVTSALALTAEFAINSYDVAATATNGTVAGAGKYNYGAEANLTATANKGYHFVKWSDGVTEASRKVTVKGNLSFAAEFAANTYTVTVKAEANGTVTGAGTYEFGATATIEAVANDGYRFAKWNDGVKTAKRTIEVAGDTTFTATFVARTYEVTVEAKNGKVEGEGSYNRGDTVELTAKANPGYHFVCWADSVAENPRKLVVNNDTTVVALFEKEAITISLNGKFGKITGSTGKLEFGATVTLTAVPDSGYHFVMWSDSVLDNPRTVTLTAELLQKVQESGFEFSAIFEKDDDDVAVNDEAAEAVRIFAFGNTVAVENADSDIFVFDAMGRLISRTAPEAGRTEIKVDGTGIYIVKTGNAAERVMIKN